MLTTGQCKFYKPHMETLLEYCNCLYKLKGCGAGGMLHILLDDNNYLDQDIIYCMNECLSHPEKEEAAIGTLICREYLKLSMRERAFFDNMWNGFRDPICVGYPDCRECPRIDYSHLELGG